MLSDKTQHQLWFTRRGTVVHGPFPAGQIMRYVILGRVLLTECKLRTGDDPADKPVTRGEVQRLLNKRAAVEQATGRPAEARLFSNAPYAEKGALELAAAGGATIWCVSLPDNWRRRADWTFGDVRPAMIAPWDVAQGDETDG